VAVVPAGFEIERGGDGPVSIQGQALRASVVSGRAAPWRVVLEGDALSFSTPAAAHPFTFTRADRFDAELRPAPDHPDPRGSTGQLLLRLTGATVAPASGLAPIAGAKPLTLDLAVRLTKPQTFKGPAWASAVQAWSQAGGEAQIVRLRVDVGAANLSVAGGALHVGADGRLAGSAPVHVALPSSLAGLPMIFGGHVSLPVRIVAVAAALARGAGGALDAPIAFQNGRAVLDGIAIGPAPRVYDSAAAAADARPQIPAPRP
jgi:hypothetical protein